MRPVDMSRWRERLGVFLYLYAWLMSWLVLTALAGRMMAQ